MVFCPPFGRSCKRLFLQLLLIKGNRIFKAAMISGINAADDIALADVVDKTFLITYTLPRFDAHKRAALFVRCPDAIRIGITTVDAKDWFALFVAEGYRRYFLASA